MNSKRTQSYDFVKYEIFSLAIFNNISVDKAADDVTEVFSIVWTDSV